MKRFISLQVAAIALAALVLSWAQTVSAGSHDAMAIYPTAKKAGFNTLSKAIEAAGLEKTLTEDGPFTVFAPTDEAFAKLPKGTLESLLKNKEALKNVLLYHVVSGEVMAVDVVKLTSAETLNGQKVKIDAVKGVKINDATVTRTDIKAKNGVIHVIDTVLIPAEVKKSDEKESGSAH
jgi:uncharacterized surface protein with fasciclin (FAS1) repeats